MSYAAEDRERCFRNWPRRAWNHGIQRKPFFPAITGRCKSARC